MVQIKNNHYFLKIKMNKTFKIAITNKESRC